MNLFESLYDYVILEENERLPYTAYHGGSWSGRTIPSVRDGSYGTGVYFTDNIERARKYATDTEWMEIQGSKVGKARYLVTVSLKIANPVVVDPVGDHGVYAGDILAQLGMDRQKAVNTIERQMERTGTAGNSIRKLAMSKGHDALIINHGNIGREFVMFNPSPFNIEVKNVENV